jgi:pimeloyl-ACP methyl ester carboxylesterase
VVAIDLPGFGASSELPGARAWEPIAETVIDLIACLELGRVTLVGHSLGGANALVAAADRPEFVERLVLATPSCYRSPLALDERLLRAPLLGRTVFRRAIGASVLRRHVGYEARSNAQTWGWLGELTAPSTIEARVPRVRAPALIVWGREDRVAPWTHGTRLARELGKARLEILDCGHFPEAERPAAVAALVREFVGVTPRRGDQRAPGARGAVR